jgi:hypothetical protein
MLATGIAVTELAHSFHITKCDGSRVKAKSLYRTYSCVLQLEYSNSGVVTIPRHFT